VPGEGPGPARVPSAPSIHEALARLEEKLDLPYPERADLIEEIAADLEQAYEARRAAGLTDDQARAEVLREIDLSDDTVRALHSVHIPAARRALLHLPPPARDTVEWLTAVVPLFGLFLMLSTEVPMAHFLREGGMFIWSVVIVGGLGLLLQLHRTFLWFVLRDHSVAALRRNTSTPLYLAAATFLLGVLATAVGYYAVFYGWSSGELSDAQLRAGLREPLPNVILGAALATLIVIVQGALQAGLRAMRIPEKPVADGKGARS
jgi:hypothetical protein